MKTPPELTLKKAPWLFDEDLARLFVALGENTVRVVGGAVRDALLNRPVTDIDMATVHPPKMVMELLEKANIKVVPTGLDHGTVTAVLPSGSIEITTLRDDVKTYGRRADVEFHKDWEGDAARRDFTINALYADAGGKIYDFAEGIRDIEKQHLRFIGDASARIQEDALRAIRYFRFLAELNWEKRDKDALSAITQHTHLLEGLSKERIRVEMLRLLGAQKSMPVLKMMQEAGVLDVLFSQYHLDVLDSLVLAEMKIDERDSLRRLFALGGGKKEQIGLLRKNFCLTNEETLLLKKTSDAMVLLKERADVHTLRLGLYQQGRIATGHALLLLGLTDQFIELRSLETPHFPVRGQDLVEKGISPGPDIGKKLKTLEQKWIDSDFTPSREKLLKL